MPLEPGDEAPGFSLPDQNGDQVSLEQFSGKKVLVYFYPKADTSGCTAQACGLRDIAGDIGDTVIIGISPDKPADQKAFDDKYTLGFTLLADVEHEVSEAYDVWQERSMYGRTHMAVLRSAFLIDEEGFVEEAWYDVSPKDTPTNLLAALGA